MTKLDLQTDLAAPAVLAPDDDRPLPLGRDPRDRRFFENAEISAILQRGLFYARAGVPIHFQGQSGRGKTALALEIARRLDRPVSTMTGHEWLNAQDLIGREVGQSTRSVVDKYVQRVRRSEEELRYDWEPSLLAEAMQQGHTLVYDEFTRASAQANSILLSVLEEGVLILTDRLSDRTEIAAHPEFRIILTSNPAEYAGVNSAPDALLDRMITFPLDAYSPETEAGIVAARTGVSAALAQRIVGLVRALYRGSSDPATGSMRAALMIARVAALRLRAAGLSDALLAQIAADVLAGRGPARSTGQVAQALATLAPDPEEPAA